MRTTGRATKAALTATVLTVVLGVSACAPQYQNHGYIPPQEDLDQITVGVDTKDSVAETVGVPVSSGILEDSGYYYVRSRKRALGFLAPQEVERQVVAISFNNAGVVDNIERFGLERGRVILLERRVTDSPSTRKPFLSQLLGTIGRFTPGDVIGN